MPSAARISRRVSDAMRYLSVCSGIEAATMAWHPLGWSPVAFSEIEKFPSQVLAHRYGSNMPGDAYATNGVPNYGDMTKFEEWPDHAVDLLVGGTPCQSFSVAGLRQGLADPRGNLMLTYLAIARRYQPRWLVWENVPGVLSSNEGRDFGTFIRGLEECGYHAAWRVLDAQYVRVDGFPHAVPQRRRRVFVVGYLGDWRRAAAVLLEPEGLRGDPAPRRQAGKGASISTQGRIGGGRLVGGIDYENNGHGPDDATGPLLKGSPTGGGRPLPAIAIASTGDIAHCLNAGGMGRQDYETETMVATRPVAATLTRGAESSGSGGYAGRRQEDDDNLVAHVHPTHSVVGTLCAEDSPHGGRGLSGLQTMLSGYIQPVAFDMRGREGGAMPEGPHDTANIRAASGGSSRSYVAEQWAVRRLTPTECERLQGFPDGFTDIMPNGKPTADGPRYKALGNSMAVNVMRWIGQRIDRVEDLTKSMQEAA